uniref:Protein REVERSION-TO-ETHYLENE SENSITIVITY1-like n=1 Tax=Nelumbo nucifera TaxID=4432 RepID=A0A822ZST1_NELNU|nr:TPA_asm: hypothetical protein HUJ06_018911 [Nelumbo nucifera]
MSPRISVMELNGTNIEDGISGRILHHELWPLDEVDPKKSKFSFCIVWTPLPVVSWLAPFIGHVGICREDGTILDFAGCNFVNVDNFAYGATARYLQLDREQVHHECSSMQFCFLIILEIFFPLLLSFLKPFGLNNA